MGCVVGCAVGRVANCVMGYGWWDVDGGMGMVGC